MRKNLYLMLLSSIMLVAQSCVMIGLGDIRGSGNTVSLQQDFSGFSKVDAHHNCRLQITRGENFSVVVRIDDNLADHLRVEKDGDTLSIGLKRGFNYRNVTLEADVTMPDLEGVGLSGASRGEVLGFRFDHDFELDLSGASGFRADMDTGDVSIDMSGASDVELTGRGGNVYVSSSGASSADLGDFEARDVEVDLSGASSVTARVNGRLRGDASGASSVYFSGDPTRVKVNKSGGARVVRR